MSQPVILFADDDSLMRTMVQGVLERSEMQVALAEDGQQALDVWRVRPVDLVILDVAMPGMDGLEVCRTIRASTNTPVMMLTSRDLEEDIVAGFEAGADDYLVKPFKPAELVARVRAILNRVQRFNTQGEYLVFGDLSLNLTSQVLTHKDEIVHLTDLEFQLLRYFLQRVGSVVSKEDLFFNVWGYQMPAGGLNLVEVAVRRLRNKIEEDPDHPTCIQSVRGQGYRLGPGY